jgi:hypothetical protein
LYVSPIVYEEPLPITIGHKFNEGMMPTVMDAMEKRYRWTAFPEDTPLTFSKRMIGRVVMTNYDLHLLSNAERRQLQLEAERNPPYSVLVDSRPNYPGSEYPLHGVMLLRSFNSILRFIALGIITGPEYHVDSDPRTRPACKTLRRRCRSMRPTASPMTLILQSSTKDVGSIRKGPRAPGTRTPWNQEAFRVLGMLYQVTVTDVSRFPTPAITIAK